MSGAEEHVVKLCSVENNDVNWNRLECKRVNAQKRLPQKEIDKNNVHAQLSLAKRHAGTHNMRFVAFTWILLRNSRFSGDFIAVEKVLLVTCHGKHQSFLSASIQNRIINELKEFYCS